MFAWRVKTSECMDMPGVLVAGSGVQEVIKKVYFFDCLWANFIFELIVCIEKVNGWKL